MRREDIVDLQTVLEKPVSILSLHTRTLNLLEIHHIDTVNDLVQMRASDFVELDRVSDGTVRDIANALAKFNLSFMPEPGKEVTFHHKYKISSDKYRKKVLRFTLQFNMKDAEAREWFEKQPDKGAYLKKLILEDKNRELGVEVSPVQNNHKLSLSDQIQSAASRATEVCSSDNLPVKGLSPDR